MPPTLNHFWKRSKRGMFLSKEYESWIRTATIQIGKVKPISLCLGWDIQIDYIFHYVKKPRRLDLDNRIKPVLDLLSKVYRIDDNMISKIVATKKVIQNPKGNDYCVVRSVITDILAEAASSGSCNQPPLLLPAPGSARKPEAARKGPPYRQVYKLF
jgi:Holliday junction resolvase RusA-like endonuclease